MKAFFSLTILLMIMLSCAGGGGFASSGEGGSMEGNDGGSTPVNAKEEVEYTKTLLKCYKTGGHRIVKIEGQLRCY